MIFANKISIPEDRVLKAVTKIPQTLDSILFKVYGLNKYPDKPERDQIQYLLETTPSFKKEENKYSQV